jgi:hypothetical protein
MALSRMPKFYVVLTASSTSNEICVTDRKGSLSAPIPS